MLAQKNLSYKIIVGMMLGMGLLISIVLLILLFSIKQQETQLLRKQNSDEIERVLLEIQSFPDKELAQTANLKIYRDSVDRENIPPYLTELPVGFDDEVESDDYTHFVTITRTENDILYIVNDISDFEKSERELMHTVIMTWIVLMALIFIVSYLLSRNLLKPISDFSDIIEKLEPGQRGLALSGQYRGLEMEKITRAFDRYLERMDEYVEKQHSFAALASHELRTPLTIIQTSAELIASQSDQSLIGMQCKKIRRSCENMSAMILALLSITRERPPQEVKEKLLLSAMIDEAIDDRQNEIRMNRTTVNNKIDRETLITSNRSLLNVVVNNLLANAIKHAPDGVIDIAYIDGQLSIRDDGSGLDADDIEQLFKPGVSGPNSRGYGLGLYISKLICDQQNWELSLNNASPGTIAQIGSIQ